MVQVLTSRVEADAAQVQRQLQALTEAEARLLGIAQEIERFIAGLPGPLEQLAEAAQEPTS